jgi:cell wall-associated NlpC family hydrolase
VAGKAVAAARARVTGGAARMAAGRARGTGRAARAGAAALAAVAGFGLTAAAWPAAAAAAAADPGRRVPASPVPLMLPAPVRPQAGPAVAPLRRLRPADLIVVSARTLPASTFAAVRRVAGVRAVAPVAAARVRVNGALVAVLGVDPSRFRAFAARPTAADTALWRAVAAGELAVSYDMGRQDRLPVGSVASVAGRQQERLLVGGLGTVGIPGVDAVVSTSVASSLGFPASNAIVVSLDTSRMGAISRRIRAAVPRAALVEPLVAPGAAATTGAAGAAAPPAAPGSQLTPGQVRVMLKAALSRVGMPYVWGAAGPRAFDCSGLVQWSFAQAGVVMPRVAAAQARTGPAVPVSQLAPGDLLFYHTDPTAPGYISHVAIYLGRGLMIQAPEPGLDVEVVPVDLGTGFAGAVAVSPRLAAAVAGAPVG